MTDLIGGIARSMKHLSERQRVVAENIANSETPGFKAREVREPSFADLLQTGSGAGQVTRPQVRLTGGMAALGARAPISAGSVMLDANTTETKPDGNNVTLEEQLLKMGQIQADFAAMTSLYRKSQGLIQSALGRKGGG
ncbi:flagellar basal body protein [Sphingomonas sp. ST-64]|uniref:Flagellar basal body protein n=1 Tax=Sphingomonas plantiphila TaxID=3163295 RepID=A0ABW8YNP9_9SPHN